MKSDVFSAGKIYTVGITKNKKRICNTQFVFTTVVLVLVHYRTYDPALVL